MIKEFIKYNEAIKWYSKGKFTVDPNFVMPNEKYFEDIITDDEFRDFLIDNGAYDEFIKFCKKRTREEFANTIKRNDRKSIIDSCLTWSETDSGNRYWNKLDDEWNNLMGGYED